MGSHGVNTDGRLVLQDTLTCVSSSQSGRTHVGLGEQEERNTITQYKKSKQNVHEFGRWDSFLFGSFHAICLLLTLTAPSYRGSPPIQETNLDPFFTHLQYCGRHESETVKAKLPWYRHIVPIHSQQQVGWIPRLIRYFLSWAINHFVVQL